MKSETELMAELEDLKADMSALMDKPTDSPEVKAWTKRILEIKAQLSQKTH
ncbi:MAG: hypothetical protein GW908_11565 [Thiomicrospira sp.]|jgi:hypothetical protein|nr:hypothetical protein [Thiomicrospira sp.]NCS64467.1 hypothetical protein [Thiomicrospira sp.]